jgi:hypothetical protein
MTTLKIKKRIPETVTHNYKVYTRDAKLTSQLIVGKISLADLEEIEKKKGINIVVQPIVRIALGKVSSQHKACLNPIIHIYTHQKVTI